jgi:hypothetical protein
LLVWLKLKTVVDTKNSSFVIEEPPYANLEFHTQIFSLVQFDRAHPITELPQTKLSIIILSSEDMYHPIINENRF